MSGSSAIPAYGYGVVEPVPDILWLKVNENTGTTTADASGAGNNFTVGVDGANCLWVTGTKSGTGAAIYSNGASGALSWGHSTANINFGAANVITICFWVVLDTPPGGDAIVFELTTNSNSNDNAFFIDYRHTQSPKQLSLSIHSGTGSLQSWMTAPAEQTLPITAGKWSHMVVVFDNSTNTGVLKAWLDGVSQSLTNTLSTKSSSGAFITATLYAGSRGASSLLTPLAMDDIRIYGRELTAAEIATVYADPQ